MSVGDVNGDGWADVAAGAPSAGRLAVDGKDHEASGHVSVWVDGPEGFLDVPSGLIWGNRTRADYDVAFGSTVAWGDLDRDGHADLVVGSSGVAFEDGDGYPGRVTTCYGDCSFVKSCTHLGWRGSALQSLTVGNVSGSARPEIVLGVLPERGEEDETGGSVRILSLFGRGPGTTAEVRKLTQGSKGVPGLAEAGDRFGTAATLVDRDEDSRLDLVRRARGERQRLRDHVGRHPPRLHHHGRQVVRRGRVQPARHRPRRVRRRARGLGEQAPRCTARRRRLPAHVPVRRSACGDLGSEAACRRGALISDRSMRTWGASDAQRRCLARNEWSRISGSFFTSAALGTGRHRNHPSDQGAACGDGLAQRRCRAMPDGTSRGATGAAG